MILKKTFFLFFFACFSSFYPTYPSFFIFLKQACFCLSSSTKKAWLPFKFALTFSKSLTFYLSSLLFDKKINDIRYKNTCLKKMEDIFMNLSSPNDHVPLPQDHADKDLSFVSEHEKDSSSSASSTLHEIIHNHFESYTDRLCVSIHETRKNIQTVIEDYFTKKDPLSQHAFSPLLCKEEDHFEKKEYFSLNKVKKVINSIKDLILNKNLY